MKKTNGKARKRKPLRRARYWGSDVLPTSLKMLLILVGIVVLGLMFSSLQAIGTLWLRLLISLALALGMLMLCFGEGLSKGLSDASASRSCEHLLAKEQTLSRKEEASGYHPLKALCAMAVVFVIPLAMACYLASTATDYTYALQDLPRWVTESYGTRSDIMSPLGAYMVQAGMTAADWCRMAVRLMVLMMINLFPDPQTMSALVDRLSPLMLLLYPLAFMAGYLLAPRSFAKREAMNRRAKKVAVRRTQKKKLTDELLGAQNQVHYGQQEQKEKHKKKELV